MRTLDRLRPMGYLGAGPMPMRTLALLTFALLLTACGEGAQSPGRTPLADKWLTRAKQGYRSGDFDDAREATQSALQAAPRDGEARLLGAKLALARLEFAEAVKLTEGLDSPEAHGVRGRAHWYQGDIEQAADELEAMLRDPAVKDPWAREIARLARRGSGRHPFSIEGGPVASVEMPSAGAALVVPVELEGERILAVVGTASGELVVDSASRKEAAWVNLRFGDHIEVKDVPAIPQDLAPLSRVYNAPIKALLGVNLLRHLHATFDRRGDQFVVRRDDPPAPPQAARVPLWYVRGGGMLLRLGIGPKEEKALLLVDSSAAYPLALEDEVWRRIGMDPTKLPPEPNLPSVRSGVLPSIRLGGFDLPRVPAVAGAPLNDAKHSLDVDIGGVVGAGLLAAFRVTFGDEGRFLWIEPDAGDMGPAADPRPAQGTEPPAAGALPPGKGATPSAGAPNPSTRPRPEGPTPQGASPAKPGGSKR